MGVETCLPLRSCVPKVAASQDNCDKSTSGSKYQKHNLLASSTADKEDYSSLFNEHLKDNGARLKADKLYCDSLSCY